MANVSRDLPIINDIKGMAAVLSLLTFFSIFAIFMLAFSLPVFAQNVDTPYCTTTGSYQVCTDQTDYYPTMTVHIAGFSFASDSSYLIKVTRPDGSVVTGDGTFTPGSDSVTADSNGNFQYDYILDGITGLYTVEILDSNNNVLATHTFTDAPNLSCTPNPANAGTSVTCTANGVGSSNRPAHINWVDATPTQQFSDVCNSGSCTSTNSPTSSGTWTVRLIKDSDSSQQASTTLTVNAVVSDQTITVTTHAPSTAAYSSSFGVAATADSGLDVAITSSGVCSGSGTNSATITMSSGTGTCTVHYNQAGNSNYNAAPEVTDTTTAEKADAIIVVTPYDVTYDGSAHTATGTATGVNGEDLSGLLDLSGTTHTNAGTYSTDAWSFTGDTNYNSDGGTVTDSIGKADAAIVVNSYSVTYDGDSHTATGTAKGVLNEDLSGLDLSGTTHTNANTYSDTWTFTDVTGNYKDTSGTVTDSIAKADATISVVGYTGIYDGDAHGATGTATGVKGESLSGLDLGNSFTNVLGGTAEWTFTDVTGNYNDASGSVAIVISKADASISVSGYSGTYDGDAHGSSGTATGVKSENLSGSLDLGATFTDVPGGTAHWTFTGGTNYNDASGDVAIDISKADATIDVTPYNVPYDTSSHTATGTATGVKGETLAGLVLTGTTHTNAGDYPTDAWAFTDVTGNYNNADSTVHDVISKATLTVIADAHSHQYSDPVPSLTYAITGFVGSDTQSVVTGSASCTTTGTQFSAAGTYPITCSIGTLAADNYDFSFVEGTMTVAKENVAISYTGDTFVTTAGPTITTAPVKLSANLIQEADSYPGDLTKAKVTFELAPVGGGSVITVANIPVSAAGDALTTANVPVGDYSVKVTISLSNLYWTQSPYGDGSLHVEAGTTDQRVTGGGWIADAKSANGKDNFGFTVNYNKNGAPKGNFLFMFRGTDGYNYQLKSNSWAKGGLSFTSDNTAYFTAKATLTEIDRATGAVVSSDGSYTFAVNIKDGGLTKPTTADTFTITIFDSSNNIWKQIGTSTLGGGNVVVHSK